MSLVKITKMDLYKIQIVLEVFFQRVERVKVQKIV
jgi:hypothetical protein